MDCPNLPCSFKTAIAGLFLWLAAGPACFAANTPSFEWARSGGSTAAFSYTPANDVAVDASGNAVSVGSFSGAATFGALALSGESDGDLFVVKYGPDGAELWAEVFGGALADDAEGVTVDGAGNVYVCGSFRGSVTIGGDTLTSAGERDGFALKLDPDGAPVWFRKLGGTGDDSARAIALDASGNIYLGGQFSGSFTAGPSTVTSAGQGDAFAAKLDSDGNVLWVSSVGGPVLDAIQGVAVDDSGNVFLGGFFGTSITLGAETVESLGQADIFVAKFGSDGSAGWVRGGGGASDDIGFEVAVDGEGDAYVCGRGKGALTFGSVAAATVSGSDDALVAKISAAGEWQWVATAGNAQQEYARSLHIGADGDLLVAGDFAHQANQPVFWGDLTIEPTASASTNTFVAKLGADGEWLWVTQAGGIVNEEASAVVAGPGSSVYVAGTFSAVAAFGQHAVTASAGGANSAYVAKLDFPETVAIIDPPKGAALLTGATLRLTVTYSAGGTVEARWYKDDEPIDGADTDALEIDGLDLSHAGTYTVRISNENGFVFSAEAEIQVFQSGSLLAPIAAIQAGGAGADAFYAIARGLDGSIYVGGSATGAVSFGGEVEIDASAGSGDAVIVKYGSNFAPVDAWAFGGSAYDVVNDLHVDASGNFYYDLITGGVHKLVKRNAAFELEWERDLTGMIVQGARYDASGTAQLAGYYASAFTLLGDPVALVGSQDAIFLAIDADGELVWSQTYGAPGSIARGYDLMKVGSAYYASGFFNAEMSFGEVELTPANAFDGFALKLDAAGVATAGLAFGGVGTDIAHLLATDGQGGIFIAGMYQTEATLGAATLSNADASSNGFVARLDADDLDPLWSAPIESNGAFLPYSLVADAGGRVVFSAAAGGLLEVAGLAGSTESRFVYDSYLMTFNGADGDLLRLERGDSTQNGLTYSIAIGAEGQLLTAGQFQGEASIGGEDLTSAGGTDALFLVHVLAEAPAGPQVSIEIVNLAFDAALGRISFDVRTEPAMEVRIYSSDTLTEWTPETTLPNPDGTIHFEGKAVGAGGSLFIQARSTAPAE